MNLHIDSFRRPFCRKFFAVLIFGIFTVVQGLAQKPSSPPDFIPPKLPTELQGESRFMPGLDPDEIIDTLVLRDEPYRQVFRLIEELTGKSVLQQESLPQTVLNFNSQGPLTRDEALTALETLLGLNGISVTSIGEKFLKAVPTSSIRFNSPDMIKGSTLDEPTSQRFYTKVFPIRHLSPEEVTQIINTIQTPGLSVQNVFKKSNSIMVTDSLVNLQQMERLLNLVDVPAKMDSTMVFRSLYYISALDLKDRLDRLYQGPMKRYFNGESYFEADERTNQIIVVTSPHNMPIIEQVITSLDVDAAPLTKTEVYYLKHAKSDDVASLINSLISGQFTGNRGSGRSNTLNERGINNPNEGGPPAPNVNANITGTTGDSTQSADQFSPFITIESDERSNAIIAFGTAGDLRYIEDLISKVDVILAQVKIDVIIAEVNLGDNYRRGIDSFGINLDQSDEITVGVNQLVDATGSFVNAVSDLPIRVGSTLENFTLNAVLQTAKSDSDVTILSAPNLMTTHNKKATISAGETRPIITASSTDTTGSSIRSQVEQQEIGIKLSFTPLIGSNGVVQLEIEQEINSVNGTTLIDGNEQPIVGSRSATSYVTVNDGEVIVLGGLQEVETKLTQGRMFLFGQIPLLGDWLFSSKREEIQRQDLVIFIRPQVIYDQQDASEITETMLEGAEHRDQIDNYIETNRFGE